MIIRLRGYARPRFGYALSGVNGWGAVAGGDEVHALHCGITERGTLHSTGRGRGEVCGDHVGVHIGGVYCCFDWWLFVLALWCVWLSGCLLCSFFPFLALQQRERLRGDGGCEYGYIGIVRYLC